MSSIHLQSIGQVPAIPVSRLKKGDRVMFNRGVVSIVKSIEKVSKSSYKIGWGKKDTNKIIYQTKRGSTLMAKLNR